MIQSYRFGQMEIEGQTHRKDLKIIQNWVITPWWRKRGHYLSIEDIDDILAVLPEMLVIGTGAYSGMQIAPELLERLEHLKIQVTTAATAKAVTTFNHHYAKGCKLAGAFHLTC